jgi:hypothetical protein
MAFDRSLMSTSLRGVFAVVLIGTAFVAAAITPAHSTGGGSHDFMGSWITWAGTPGGERPVCRRLQVTAGEGTARSGGWDAPGWNGLVNGALSVGDDGRPVLTGEWRDGRIAGAFTLQLQGHDALDGAFAAPGETAPRHWQGRRDTGQQAKDLPCRFEE